MNSTTQTRRPTAKQQLASHLLGEDVMVWLGRARENSSSWRDVVAELSYRTNGAVSVTEQTIHNWRRGSEPRRTRAPRKSESTRSAA